MFDGVRRCVLVSRTGSDRMARMVVKAPSGPRVGVTRGRLYALCTCLVQALYESCTEEELERYALLLQECLLAGVPIDDARNAEDPMPQNVVPFDRGGV
jgi:hypothetical protein